MYKDYFITGSPNMSTLLFDLVFILGFITQIIHTAPEKCSPTNCSLPKCFCAGRDGPQSISKDDLPQIVVFTFDDAVNEQNFDYYKKLLKSTRRNSNGCPISATFFVSDEWTNYDMVKSLYLQGHEVSSHSITHRTPHSWWSSASYKDWTYEMDGQRDNIAKGAYVPKSEVRGVRIPFLQLGANTQYRMLTDKGFQYDASCITGPYSQSDWRKPVWPYTLDFAPELEYCDSSGRPQRNFSGFWEVPLNRWLGLDGKPCPMVDACTTQELNNKGDALRYLEKNFKRHYDNNRAPFGVNMHAVWFKDEFKLEAMDEFIEYLTRLDDVWIVTVYQMIEWMRSPTPQAELRTFEPWLSCRKSIKLLRPRNTDGSAVAGNQNSNPTRREGRPNLRGDSELDVREELEEVSSKPSRPVESEGNKNRAEIRDKEQSKRDPSKEEGNQSEADIQQTREDRAQHPGGQPHKPSRNPVLRDEGRESVKGNSGSPGTGPRPGSGNSAGGSGRPYLRPSSGLSGSSPSAVGSTPGAVIMTVAVLVASMVATV